MEKIGFIGLGRMGRPMACNLCRKGFSLTVHDINADAVAELVAQKAAAATSPSEVAKKSDIIITMLPDSKVVTRVVAGPGGVIESAASGSIIMDMSTVDPETTDRLAEQAAQKGIGFVDAPVGRLASHADRGESLFMVGATETDLKRVMPLLEAMGTTIYHCGNPGTGTRTKLVNNYLAVTSCQLNAEALALSQRFNLNLERTLDVLYGTTAVNGQLKIAWPAKVLKGDIDPGFTIDLAHKDLTLIIEAANAAKVPMPIAATAREAFSAARARGFGGNDFSAMVDSHCESVDIPKPRLK